MLDTVAGLGAKDEDDVVPALEGVTLTGWTDAETLSAGTAVGERGGVGVGVGLGMGASPP